MEPLIQRIASALETLPFLHAVVLGGSRATGTVSATSDVDIGIYYDRTTLDLSALNRVAQSLDDAHRESLVCAEGGWGPWVNCGGWLTVEGVAVDLILRDLDRVRRVLDDTDQGIVNVNYQTGHPHGFLNVTYRGELAVCKTLWSRPDFDALKARAQLYPDAMRAPLLGSMLFEARFSVALSKKSLPSGDRSYIVGHLYRGVSAMNQALFALNRAWCLNEKKAVLRVESLPVHPEQYRARVERVFDVPSAEAVDLLDALVTEVESLCS